MVKSSLPTRPNCRTTDSSASVGGWWVVGGQRYRQNNASTRVAHQAQAQPTTHAAEKSAGKHGPGRALENVYGRRDSNPNPNPNPNPKYVRSSGVTSWKFLTDAMVTRPLKFKTYAPTSAGVSG